MSNIQNCKGKESISYRVGDRDYTFPLKGYGTHLPLLLDVISQANIKTALEIGCGECSTPILASTAQLEIVEQDDPQWAERAKRDFPDIKTYIAMGKDAWRDLKLADHYDLVFIDGHETSRVDIAHWAASHADIIILHDTEPAAVCYGWERLNIPWHRYDYTDFVPHTTVFSKKPLVL